MPVVARQIAKEARILALKRKRDAVLHGLNIAKGALHGASDGLGVREIVAAGLWRINFGDADLVALGAAEKS